MADPKSRARVARLLSGTFRPDDLTTLFLYARDHCDGREPVAEIGHFVAHHHERDKGIVTRATRDWFTTARFHFAQFGPNGPNQLHANSLPAASRDYYKIAVNRTDPRLIRTRTGLRRSEAHGLALDIANRMIANSDGTWALPKDISRDELDLIQFLSSFLVVRPAFKSIQIVDDFIETLKSNGLITKEEIRRNSAELSIIIQLYAVSVMHNCIVKLQDGSETKLVATHDGEQIVVRSSVPSPNSEHSSIFFACNIFAADLVPSVHCSAELMQSQDWNFEIELTPEKILAPLR